VIVVIVLLKVIVTRKPS